MKKIKKLYLLDRNIKWATFKKLQDRLTIPDGITIKNIDKILWQMLRDGQIYCWFHNESKGDMGIGVELPGHKELIIIKRAKTKI